LPGDDQPEEFARAFQRFLDWVPIASEHADSFAARLADHFGVDPKSFPAARLMTTNRADLIEPALAARPGRVDQAVEFPLPDSTSREKLLNLFCEDLDIRATLPALVERTEGASPAFLRELVRKASLFAAVSGDQALDDSHFD
jgi:ATP-dependent 26S proteasome regulatory subunit